MASTSGSPISRAVVAGQPVEHRLVETLDRQPARQAAAQSEGAVGRADLAIGDQIVLRGTGVEEGVEGERVLRFRRVVDAEHDPARPFVLDEAAHFDVGGLGEQRLESRTGMGIVEGADFEVAEIEVDIGLRYPEIGEALGLAAADHVPAALDVDAGLAEFIVVVVASHAGRDEGATIDHAAGQGGDVDIAVAVPACFDRAEFEVEIEVALAVERRIRRCGPCARNGAKHLAIFVADQHEQEQPAIDAVARIGGDTDERLAKPVEVEIGVDADHVGRGERPVDQFPDEDPAHRVGERLAIGRDDVGLLREQRTRAGRP